MCVRIVTSPAIEPKRPVIAEAIFGGIELRMLSGEDQRRGEAANFERSGNGGKLDRFGTGPDDKRNTTEQLSP